MDCAAAELDFGVRNISQTARVGLGGNLTGCAAPFTVDPVTGRILGSACVYKAGRTTGWTEGHVTQLAVVADIKYGSGYARFHNQLGIAASPDNSGPFSKPGDSGSGIVNKQQELVGLLFAGSATITLANPIADVIDALKAELGVLSLTVIT